MGIIVGLVAGMIIGFLLGRAVCHNRLPYDDEEL
jgi:uncharacterized protein YneF (UPF0154 family)